MVSEDKRWCSGYEAPCASVTENWRGIGHAAASPSAAFEMAQWMTEDSVAGEMILRCNLAEVNPPVQCIKSCFPRAC